jgi:hypothetical protein
LLDPVWIQNTVGNKELGKKMLPSLIVSIVEEKAEETNTYKLSESFMLRVARIGVPKRVLRA